MQFYLINYYYSFLYSNSIIVQIIKKLNMQVHLNCFSTQYNLKTNNY